MILWSFAFTTRNSGSSGQETVKFYCASPESGAAGAARLSPGIKRDQGGDDMARVFGIGDLMTDTVAHAPIPLAKGSDTPATVSMPRGGAGANIAAWLAGGGSAARLGRRRAAD